MPEVVLVDGLEELLAVLLAALVTVLEVVLTVMLALDSVIDPAAVPETELVTTPITVLVALPSSLLQHQRRLLPSSPQLLHSTHSKSIQILQLLLLRAARPHHRRSRPCFQFDLKANLLMLPLIASFLYLVVR